MIPSKKTWHITKLFFQPSAIKKLNYLFYKLNLCSDFFSINKEKITEDFQLSENNLLNGKYILAQKGKKNYFLIIVA